MAGPDPALLGDAPIVVVDGVTMTVAEARLRKQAGILGEVETAGERAARALERIEEERYGSTLQTIETAAQGAARAITFGGSDLALEALGQGDLVEAYRRVNPGAALAGEVGGAVLISLATAGGGATGAARLASLTPRGAMAARGARWAAAAPSALRTAGRRVVYEAAEGGADAATAYLVRQAIRDGEIDGSELGTRALQGALLGAGAGAAGEAIGAGLGVLARRLAPRAEVAALDAVQAGRREAAERAALSAPDVRVSDLTGRRGPARSLEAHRDLESHVRRQATRGAAREVDDLLSRPSLAGSGVEETVRQQARRVEEAGALAEAWRSKYSAALGKGLSEANYAARAAAVDPALTRDGSKVLAALDDAVDELDASLRTLRQADEAAVAATAAPAPGSVAERVRAVISTNPTLARAGELATQVAAGAEVAQAAGLDVPSVSQIVGGGAVGQAVGLLIGARALGGRGGTRLAEVAGRTVPGLERVAAVVGAGVQYRAQIRQAIATGLAKAGRPVARAALKSASRVAQEPRHVDRGQIERARASALEATADLPPEIGQSALAEIDRTAAYLDQHAPQPPDPTSPWAAEWSPDPVSAREWARRYAAATSPERALDRALTDPSADLEIEALRECHPGIYGAVQERLRALDLAGVRRLRPALRHSLSRGFGVALLPQYLPGYAAAPPSAPPGPPAVAEPATTARFAAPANAAASQLVKGEQVFGPHRGVS